MKAVIHKTGAIGEVLGIERRDGVDYVYFESGLCKPVSEVGFLNPYEQYLEDVSDWSDFRREAAKDILVAAIKADDEREVIFEDKNFPCYVRQSIKLADELIKQLKEEK